MTKEQLLQKYNAFADKVNKALPHLTKHQRMEVALLYFFSKGLSPTEKELSDLEKLYKADIQHSLDEMKELREA